MTDEIDELYGRSPIVEALGAMKELEVLRRDHPQEYARIVSQFVRERLIAQGIIEQ